MKVVALETWTNGSITMEEKQVADIPDDLAEKLIEKGIVAESPEYYGGGASRFIVELTLTSESGGTTNKTAKEMTDAYNAGKKIVFRLVNFPTTGSYRDMDATEAQYNAQNNLISFSGFNYASGIWAYITTSYTATDDAAFSVTAVQ